MDAMVLYLSGHIGFSFVDITFVGSLKEIGQAVFENKLTEIRPVLAI